MIVLLRGNLSLYVSITLVIVKEYGVRSPVSYVLGWERTSSSRYLTTVGRSSPSSPKLETPLTKDSNFENGKIIINGKKYPVDTLGHLSMRTFSERINHKVLDSNFYLLSNYYPCNFVFRKQKDSNVEQAYQHVKVVLFNDQTSATDILSSDDPAAATRLGFTIYGFSSLPNYFMFRLTNISLALLCHDKPINRPKLLL